MTVRAWLLAVTIGASLGSVGSVNGALADDRTAAPAWQLRLTVPTEVACLTLPLLRAEVAERIGRDPFVASGGETLRVAVMLDEQGLSARIERGESVREVTAPAGDCMGLRDALALSLAIAIDPVAASAYVPPEPGLEPEPNPEPELEPETETATETKSGVRWSEPGAPRRWGASVFVGGQATLGTTPGLGGGLEVGVGGWRNRWAVELSGRIGFRTSTERAPGSVSAVAWWGAARGCRRRLVGPLVVCASVALGQVRGRGEGFVENSADATLLAMAGARVGAPVRVGAAVYLVPFVEAHGHLVRTNLRVDGEIAWPMPAAQLAAGVALSFGAVP